MRVLEDVYALGNKGLQEASTRLKADTQTPKLIADTIHSNAKNGILPPALGDGKGEK